MTTHTRSRRWLFLVDERHGTLLLSHNMPGDRVRLDPVAEMKNGWEEHQHGRPSPLAAKNGHTNASIRHEAEALRRHFADDVVAWIEKEAARHDIDTLHVFAPTRLLGEIRSRVPKRLVDSIRLHDGNLAGMHVADLPGHPSVSAVLGGT